MKYSNPQLDEIYQELNEKSAQLTVEEIKKDYLGKNGKISLALSHLKELSPEEKPVFGKEINQLKQYAQELLSQKELADFDSMAQSERIDPTAPFDVNTPTDKRPAVINKAGTQHPLTKEMEYILDVFRTMGFSVEDCRQLDNDYNMFEALNFPQGHPARDNWDTFWTEEGLIPPAHTSTMQNRVLRKYEPPIRVVVPGRSYRNEATDARHEHTLHQVEGVYVDKKISLSHMLGTIKAYLEGFFGRELEIKLQPAFFPFTEPDLEFIISCPFCNKAGCTTCGKSGWLEVMGCGMIHPNVLREAGIDPEVYSGFAWGFGMDRLVMIKNSIEDIRWLHSGDIKFLKQFNS